MSFICLMESELVSGFMTEHAAVIFVFFFLAEYASIVLICILISVLFLGGYLTRPIFSFSILLYIVGLFDAAIMFVISILDVLNLIYEYIYSYINVSAIIYVEESIHKLNYNIYYSPLKEYITMESLNSFISDPIIEGILYGITLGLKTCIMIFVFIWARASLPRIRFDQLMSFSWTILLPLVISFIILVPCALHSFSTIPSNVFLL